LFTDFGWNGPYVGQLHAALLGAGRPVIDLQHDAPAFAPRAAAYLLAALADELPPATLFLAVVDPGVGGARRPLLLRTGRGWLVGPDNGLLAVAARRQGIVAAWEVAWRPPRLSASFHGRDLFAPVCVALCRGEPPPGVALAPVTLTGWDWPEELAEVIYFDDYGNAYSGVRASGLARTMRVRVGGRLLEYARTFAEVAPGVAFWYENSCGLLEVAVNQGSARRQLDLRAGVPVELVGG